MNAGKSKCVCCDLCSAYILMGPLDGNKFICHDAMCHGAIQYAAIQNSSGYWVKDK